MNPDDHLEDEMQQDACVGGQADILLHSGDSRLDYSHLPPSTEAPPRIEDMTKVASLCTAIE